MSRTSRFFLFLFVAALIALAGLWILGNKKSDYSTSVVIDAHPSQVFPYLTQPDRLKQWLTGLEQVDEILPPPAADEYTSPPKMIRTWNLNGTRTSFNDLVIRYNLDEMVSVQSSNANQVVTSIYELDLKDANKTLLTYQVKSTNVGLGRLLAVFRSTDIESTIARDARKLKELVEKNEPPSTGPADDEASFQVPGFGGEPADGPLKQPNAEVANPSDEGER